MASGSGLISQALSEDPYSNHQLLPVPFGDQYHATWEEFCIAIKADSPNKTLYCSKEIYDEWYTFQESFAGPLPPPLKETPRPPKQKEPKGKLKAPVMTDIDTQKLFRSQRRFTFWQKRRVDATLASSIRVDSQTLNFNSCKITDNLGHCPSQSREIRMAYSEIKRPSPATIAQTHLRNH